MESYIGCGVYSTEITAIFPRRNSRSEINQIGIPIPENIKPQIGIKVNNDR